MPPDSRYTVRCIKHRGTAAGAFRLDNCAKQTGPSATGAKAASFSGFFQVPFPTKYFGIRQLLRRYVNSDMCASIYNLFVHVYLHIQGVNIFLYYCS